MSETVVDCVMNYLSVLESEAGFVVYEGLEGTTNSMALKRPVGSSHPRPLGDSRGWVGVMMLK